MLSPRESSCITYPIRPRLRGHVRRRQRDCKSHKMWMTPRKLQSRHHNTMHKTGIIMYRSYKTPVWRGDVVTKSHSQLRICCHLIATGRGEVSFIYECDLQWVEQPPVKATHPRADTCAAHAVLDDGLKKNEVIRLDGQGRWQESRSSAGTEWM